MQHDTPANDFISMIICTFHKQVTLLSFSMTRMKRFLLYIHVEMVSLTLFKHAQYSNENGGKTPENDVFFTLNPIM